MSGVGVRVSREGPGLSLPVSLAGTAGSVTGDNIDWVDGGDAPGTITNTGDFELKNEGGQDHIDAHGSMGSAETFDPTDGNVHTGTLNADCTFTLNPPTGTGFCSMEFWLSQDGTGGWVITWPGSVTEVGTQDTTLSSTSRVIVETVDGGTSWLATWVGADGADAELNIEGGQSVIKAHGSMGATETFDPTDGNVHTGTLDANCTFTLNAPTGTGACTLELWLTEDGTGGRTVTWPGSVTEQGTHDTTLSTTSRVILETIDGGTSWIATWIGGASGASFAAPAIVLGSSAAAGAATTVIRSDATIAAFDATVPVTQAFNDVAATGSAAFAARRDHVHGMPASGGGASEHAHIVSETHLSNGSTTTWTLDNTFEVGSVIAWNTTTLARLTVTEVQPDQATVSAAGTTGDSIVFDYAATLA